MGALEDILKTYEALPDPHRQEIDRAALRATSAMKWIPNPGPQTQAYFSLADCLLFGGEPGGGKSQLILGCAFNCHERALIMRRKYGDLSRLIEDALKIHGSRVGFNGSPPPKLRISDAQVIDFAAAHRVGDEQDQMGKGRDLLGIDEATHFAESQIRFLMGWNRTDTPGQRVRTILATNPPLRAEGLWVIKMFAPWLDPRYPNPAKPGELRWVVSDEDGNDLWVDGPDDCREIKGKIIRPTSRTYIPSKVSDNPFYAATDYERQLDAMPEPYRSLLMGGFRTAFKDEPNQIIPTDWVSAAQERWTSRPPVGVPMCALAVDCSGGGADPMVTGARHDGWFAPFEVTPGRDIPQDKPGRYAAGIVMAHRRDQAIMIIDMGGGYGGPLYEHLKANFDTDPDRMPVVIPFKGSEGSTQRTRDGLMAFKNRRTEALWRMREALDPDQAGGSPIMFPDDSELVADLTAPTFEIVNNVIVAEPKDDVCDRLGRSTDKGDTACMCWTSGPIASTDGAKWDQLRHEMGLGGRLGGRRPQAILARQPLTGRRR